MKIDYEEKSRLFEKKSIKFLTTLNIFVGAMLLLIFITMMIWCYYHEAKVVSGESMQPTINSDYSEIKNQFDIVIVNKTQNISRGDIVIIDFSNYEDELIIKRVIALAGDSLKIVWNNEKKKADVYLKKSGEKEFCLLIENYTQNNEHNIPPKNNCASSFTDGSTGHGTYIWNGCTLNDDGSITILDGYFFALGDNREKSKDSSEVGPFLRKNVIGVAETLEKNGTFMNKFLRKFFHLTLNKNK